MNLMFKIYGTDENEKEIVFSYVPGGPKDSIEYTKGETIASDIAQMISDSARYSKYFPIYVEFEGKNIECWLLGRKSID